MRQAGFHSWHERVAALAAAVLLALATLLLAPAPLAADEPSEELATVTLDVRLYQDGEPPAADGEAELGLQGDYGTDYASARAALNTGLMNVDEEIMLNGFRVHKDEVATLVAQVANDNPDLFYVHGKVSVSYYPSTGFVHHIVPVYAYDVSAIPGMKAAYYAALDEVLSWVPEGATDVEKVKAVHDWLVRNCAYNYDAEAAGHDNYVHDPWCAYGALVTHDPVCQGYALAFRAAMRALGIPCDYVEQWESDDNGHAWNRVYLVVDGEGAWYNLDVTHDDSDSSFDTTPSTTYFLKSDAWFQANPSAGTWHTWWTPEGVAGTDTRFDGYAQEDWPTYAGPADVRPPAPTAFELSATELLLETYSEADVTVASVEPADASWYDRAWSSSDPAVAAVDRAGHITTAGATGTATLTCTIGDVSRTVEVTVAAPNDLVWATVEGISDATYNGSAQVQDLVVTHRGTVLTEGTDFTASYEGNTNVGTATVTITGIGSYTGTVERTFQIEPAALSGATIAAVANQPYTGKAVKPSPKVTVGGRTLTPGTDYTLSYANNVKAGTATITITGTGNYTGTRTVTFKIVAPSVTYRVHVQTYGWQGWKKDGAAAGTTGKAKRLEGIYIKLSSKPVSGGIQYRTHVQRIGWQGWRNEGTMAGTTGQALRLEAIQIRLTGQMAERYDVWYRVHAQHFGWMGWAKNGASAGTAGYAYRLEAIEIVILPKGSPAPGSTLNAFRQKK